MAAMDDDETQQFSLRWHNHQSSVVGALGEMLSSGALSDVTLCAADGGAALRAHRVVLAAASQYFADILKEVECGSGCGGCGAGCGAGGVLVVVAGCGAAELRLLLTFMYTGEVTAARARLPALLALARTLRVSGLTDTENTLADPESEPLNLGKPESEPERGYAGETAAGSDRDRLCGPERGSGPAGGGGRPSAGWPECPSETAAGSDRDRLSRLDQIVQNLYTTHKLALTPSPGLDAGEARDSTCGVCGKRLSNRYNLRVHMDTHAGRRHACRACPHVSRSRDALRKHVAYRHARAPAPTATPLARDRLL
ncbi:broad-complex core protein isoforms 1/2/3/4/5-like [Aricia agestis]|uniref:broad-complex core protein isoforms 1/2/3/4/5-like n=1 Tax=Aricia agestis TaxID=91739 RepID=UPI001C206152|nr:broad-complex core protein isoforms 1/2/3/4/5-like [Aricia agestis]